MRKRPAIAIWYDELSGDSVVSHTCQKSGDELMLTHGDDGQLVKELYAQTPEDEEMLNTEEGPDWTVVEIVHTPKATLVEWKSGNGHFACTTIHWQ